MIKIESESYKVDESESDSSEENQSEQFQFEPGTSTAEFSAREVPTQQYEKLDAPEEEELSEPSTSRPVSSYIDPDYQSEKFYQQPEEEVFDKWSRLSPILENNPCLDWKVELDSEGSNQYFEEETSSSSSSENFRMAQPAPPTYVQMIPITANIQPFRGLRADGELHF